MRDLFGMRVAEFTGLTDRQVLKDIRDELTTKGSVSALSTITFSYNSDTDEVEAMVVYA